MMAGHANERGNNVKHGFCRQKRKKNKNKVLSDIKQKKKNSQISCGFTFKFGRVLNILTTLLQK